MKQISYGDNVVGRTRQPIQDNRTVPILTSQPLTQFVHQRAACIGVHVAQLVDE
jgi:hypothetical protein